MPCEPVTAPSDPEVLDRLGIVKEMIERAPHRILDVHELARAVALNRTKLRSAFKQAYGTTLSEYGTSLMLRRADCAQASRPSCLLRNDIRLYRRLQASCVSRRVLPD